MAAAQEDTSPVKDGPSRTHFAFWWPEACVPLHWPHSEQRDECVKLRHVNSSVDSRTPHARPASTSGKAIAHTVYKNVGFLTYSGAGVVVLSILLGILPQVISTILE